MTAAGHVITAQALTRRAFTPYGDVIETDGAPHFPINQGTVERFHDLASVDPGEGGRVLISIVEVLRACGDPVPVRLVERHPLGSQAFIPLDEAAMCVVVAQADEEVGPDDLRAFISNGRQGVNYHPGTWHMPLVAFEPGRRFLVVDRGGPGGNCEERHLDSPVEIRVESVPGRET